MRKLLILVVLGGLLYSCGEEEEKEVIKEYTVISGKFDNFKSRSITLRGYNFEKKISFDRKKGTFRDTLTTLTKDGHYT